MLQSSPTAEKGTLVNRTLRTLALPAAAALMLTGCSLPFEIVPREDSPTAQESTEDEATEVSTEEAPTQAEIEETVEEQEPTDTDGDGRVNHDVTPQEALPFVVEACDLPEDTLADEGMTLILDTPGTEPDSGTLAVEDAGCAVGYLDPPDWLMQQIESTKLDGTRETAVDGYLTYSWTISDEEGLDFVVRVSEEEN